MGLILQQVDKVVDGETHLKDINIQFKPGSKNILLGRTLAGKTSLLRLMAGLDRPTRGKLIINGQDMAGISVRKRSVAMVYQQFINYPSLTVFDNIGSPLKVSGVEKPEIDRRVREVAEILHIDHLLDRLPAELSGGQQQRTAIARALVKDAELLLLDEPLVNLDYKLREELRVELQAIFKKRQAVVVYTTTEPAEALMLGGHVVVVDEGRVLQSGPTAEVYHNPGTMKVAEVFSDPPINYIKGNVEGDRISIGQGVAVARAGHLKKLTPGEYRFGIRSNHLFLDRRRDSDLALETIVNLSEINGSETFLHVSSHGTDLVVQEEGIRPRKIGTPLSVFVSPESLFVYDREGVLAASPNETI